MAENDSRDDVRTLYREAARTKTDEERVIVEKIDRLTLSIGRADEEIARIRGQIREVAARRIEIDPPFAKSARLERRRNRLVSAGDQRGHTHANAGCDNLTLLRKEKSIKTTRMTCLEHGRTGTSTGNLC